MQTLWLLLSICDSLDATVRNFIWCDNPSGSRGWNMVKWDLVARPRRLGGLGVK